MNKKSKLQMIPTDKLHPHPDNPRKVIGDVSELAESIKANGILQNLTVVPNNDNWDDFTVIIGHRRLAAAKPMIKAQGKNPAPVQSIFFATPSACPPRAWIC